MKIFNWVHCCRFNRHKAENEKTSGGEEQILLENRLLEAVDGWKAGVLAIGTFGYDCLRGDDDDDKEEYVEEYDDVYKEESEKEMSDSDEDEDQINSEDEVIPLVVYAANYNAHDYDYDYDYESFPNIEFEDMSPKKERKTLAELFYAEEVMQQEKQAIKKMSEVDLVKKKWNNNNNKHAATLSFAKKDVHRPTPIQKMHRLMRRMLKRKIHPAADMGLNKQNPIDDSEIVVKNAETSTSGSALLLPTQDALV